MVYIVVVVLALIADRIAKLWAASVLTLEVGGVLPILPGFLHFTYVENTGAAFGILSGQRWIFVTITSLVVVLIIFEMLRTRKKMNRFYGVSLSFLLAGALGNLVDRIFQGYVVDFIEFRFINFAVFNVADICVTFGVILLMIHLLFLEGKDLKKNRTPVTDAVSGQTDAHPIDEMGSAFASLGGDTNDPEYDALLRYYENRETPKPPQPHGAGVPRYAPPPAPPPRPASPFANPAAGEVMAASSPRIQHIAAESGPPMPAAQAAAAPSGIDRNLDGERGGRTSFFAAPAEASLQPIQPVQPVQPVLPVAEPKLAPVPPVPPIPSVGQTFASEPFPHMEPPQSDAFAAPEASGMGTMSRMERREAAKKKKR